METRRQTTLKSLLRLGVVCAVFHFTIGFAQASEVYLSLDTVGQGSYTVDGRFWTPGDQAATWSTLSDYDHLHFFVPSLEKSQVTERSVNFLLLKQEAMGRALVLFHHRVHVLLKVREQPKKQILFEDISHQDFSTYSGFWKIEPAAGGGSWVDYRLLASPNFYAPSVIARHSFQKMAKELLMSVQSEIVRRGHLKETLLCCSQR